MFRTRRRRLVGSRRPDDGAKPDSGGGASRPETRGIVLRRLAALVWALLVPAVASAQQATITGTVRSQTLGPVRGAYVAIPDLEVSTITNDQGAYLLLIPAERARGQQVTMVVSNVGYETQELTVTLSGETQRLDITLSERAITLDEVVVTGTAGRLERRAQAAQVSTIDAGELTELAPVTNMASLLQARTPGVTLQLASGTSGTAQTIRIRGTSSISLSNEPLVFIDGVRADSRSQEIYGVGGQEISRLNDIRPEDIESIEIVKGPAAATLYGADASAGVIQIITKRGRANSGFTQTLSYEYNSIDANFDAPDNYGVCQQAHIDAGRALCQGVAPGTVVTDNPLSRYGVLRRGQMNSLTWSGRGGGENYAFYFSLGGMQEDGTTPNNSLSNYSGRFNFDFIPSRNLRIEAGLGLIRDEVLLPHNDNNIYGYLGGTMLGSPLSVGTPNDGWYGFNRTLEAVSALETSTAVVRAQPRFAINYTPYDWFTNRLTIGADLNRIEAYQFWPRNSELWYDSQELNSGQIGETRQHSDRITVDYLGNISNLLTDWLSSDLSFGLQFTDVRTDEVQGTGIGLFNNDARSVGAGARRQADQSFSETRQIGVLGQWMAGIHDRLFLTLGGRLDQSSAFAREADLFFSPKVGVSYVLSDEPAIREFLPSFIGTLRARASWGETPRSPATGIIATYQPAPYAIDPTTSGGGIVAFDPGNTKLKPERGVEYEAGFDASLLDDRLGLEVTYFDKASKDLILARPIAPSAGFQQEPLVNIGEVINRGLEVLLTAQVLTLDDFGWEALLGFSTLHNEVTSLGEVEPYGSLNRVQEGLQVGAFVSRKILRVEEYAPNPAFPDSTALRAIVSDSSVFLGNLLPTFQGTFSSTLNFLRNLRVYAQLDWQSDFAIYNNTAQFRERQFRNDANWVLQDEILSDEARVRRFGPYFDAEGNRVSSGAVLSPYIEQGDFLRLREVSATYSLPQAWARRLRASGASITLGGRNLALWTDYTGFDPEVNSATQGLGRQEFLTLPPARRWIARINLRF